LGSEVVDDPERLRLCVEWSYDVGGWVADVGDIIKDWEPGTEGPGEGGKVEGSEGS